MEDGSEEATAFGLGSRELRFELVAQGNELIDLGDDAVLAASGTPSETCDVILSSIPPAGDAPARRPPCWMDIREQSSAS